MKSPLEFLQSLGRALMLPIAVLPVAGLLLRIGQPDLAGLPFMAAAGDVIFSNLGLLFAIGVAVGFARENNGTAGLAGVVCFLIATHGAQVLLKVPPETLKGLGGAVADLAEASWRAKAIAKLSVPMGIVSGLVGGGFYNRFSTVKLPEYLAFFAGRRFVSLVAGLAGVALAAAVGLGYAAIGSGMDGFSRAITGAGALGLFAFGLLNRLLLVTGLHHILNNITWFVIGDYHGATGDLRRFFAGDPSAGAFMSGFFPVMMFGLPAACLAMYRAAPPDRRKAVGGMYLSLALTSFLTGVTEPIEFTFMFLAPVLFIIHAILTGLAMVILDVLGVRLGFSFSAGLFDYLLNFGKSTKPWLLLPIGIAYFAIYYGVFRGAIAMLRLKTPGREPLDAEAPAAPVVRSADDRGAAFVAALGGADNIEAVDACTTRLRLILADVAKADERRLRALGARGFVRPSANTFQVVLGPVADAVAGEIRTAAGRSGAVSRAQAAPAAIAPAPAAPVRGAQGGAWLAALGGATNVVDCGVASSRLWLELKTTASVDEAGLAALGARTVTRTGAQGLHVIIGPEAEAVAAALAPLLTRP